MKQLVWPILISLILASCSGKVELDESQAETFNKFYGNSGQDEACEIRELADGSFLIFGTIQTASKSTELALIKTDRFGNEQWTKTFGRESADIGGGMDIAANGNIIMVGTSTKVVPQGEENITDLIIVEVDASGNLTSESEYLPSNPLYYDGGDNEEGHVILYDFGINGGFIAAGSSDKQNNSTFEGTQFINAKFVKDYMFLRLFVGNTGLDTNEVYFGFEGDDIVYDGLQLTNDSSDFQFVGQSSKLGVIRPFVLAITNKTEGVFPFIIFKDFGDYGANAIANSIVKTQEGYFVTGSVQSVNNSVFLRQLIDEQGVFGPDDEDFIRISRGSVRANAGAFDFASGSYLLAGSTNTGTGGGFDHYLVSVSPDRQVNWEKTYGGTGTEEALAISPTKDGGYIIGGYSGFEGNSLINVIKTDNKGNLNP